MSYLEPILVHPVRRQIFGDTSGQTFYMTRDPVLADQTLSFPVAVQIKVLIFCNPQEGKVKSDFQYPRRKIGRKDKTYKTLKEKNKS